MSKQAKSLGRQGEDYVVAWLGRRGFRILERNVHSQYGEIDIVAKKNERYYFIEVKTRRSGLFGSATEALTNHKQERLLKTVQTYLTNNQLTDIIYQIDLITLEKEADHWKIEWLANIIDESE